MGPDPSSTGVSRRTLILASAVASSLLTRFAVPALAQTAESGDPLPSWNDTASKKAVRVFVDLQMLQYTMDGSGPRFALVVHHTDGLREWAYDRKSPIGRLDKALNEAEGKGWTVVDMKNDWKTIFPFGSK